MSVPRPSLATGQPVTVTAMPLRTAALPALLTVPLLFGGSGGVLAQLPMTFEPLYKPAVLPDGELVAAPSALDRCRCQSSCAARPACLSVSHCPGDCRLYGRRGNSSTWQQAGADCVLLLRSRAARLADYCGSDGDCARLAAGATCLEGVCGCPPPLLAAGEGCEAPPASRSMLGTLPANFTVPCEETTGRADCGDQAVAVGLTTKKPRPGKTNTPLLRLFCVPFTLGFNNNSPFVLYNQDFSALKDYRFETEQAVIRGISMEGCCSGTPATVRAVPIYGYLGPERIVSLVPEFHPFHLLQNVTCDVDEGELLTGVRWLDGRDQPRVELVCRQLHEFGSVAANQQAGQSD